MSMDYDDAQKIEEICYCFKLADFPRGDNRARINKLFNGWPPFSKEEEEENGIVFNVNDLSGTRLAHDARQQLYGAFLRPGKFFSMTCDAGPAHKRPGWNQAATFKINQLMKRSIDYFETFRSKFALDILHGIGPAVWENSYGWCPDAIGIEDVLVPSKTLLTMKNLPFFALYRSFTIIELLKLTRGPMMDPGWDKELVDLCVEWADSEAAQLMGSTWPEVWSPEKMQERVKGDGGFYASDAVPTIDTFDFYFYYDDGKKSGWRRRIILDSWGTPEGSGSAVRMAKRDFKGPSGQKLFEKAKRQFLYTSGKRFYAKDRREIVSFQFADLSSVAPFQYHSVRSLGFLVYAMCHIQNRLQGKFNEAVFEALMPYFKCKTMEDAQRALKLNMITRGIIDDTLVPLTAQERYQVNTGLVELGLKTNADIINRNAGSFTQANMFSSSRTEKTKYQVMAEVQSMTTLISSGLNQAYQYQEFEDREILRRFFIKGSKDHDVQVFQGAMERVGVPQKYMVVDAWDTSHEKVLGAGNQTLEMGIAEWLMANREKYDPDSQRLILHKATFAVTGDPGFTDELVPDKPVTSSSVHDAQLAAATLLMGLPMAFKQGVNHEEYAGALLLTMAMEIGKISKRDNMGTPDDLAGLQNIAGMTITGQPLKGNGIHDHIEVLAEDKDAKEKVKKLNDQLTKLLNQVKGFAQRLGQQMKKQQQQQAQNGNGEAAKARQELELEKAKGQQKLQQMRESHATRTAQRQIQFEQESKQREQQHAQDMIESRHESALDLAHKSRMGGLEE